MRISLLSILLLSIIISGCFSKPDKKSVVIVDKSTYQYAVEKPQTPIVSDKNPITNMPLPVAGKIIKSFSKQHPGISFDTTHSQTIRAIEDGIVVYSDEMKNHGQMLVIKHKLGFYSTYTQAENLRVSQGDKVKKWQIIAFTNKQAFYFSMRKFRTPIDPLKYLTR